MRRALVLAGSVALLCAAATPAAAQMTPGTVKLLTKNDALVETSSGVSFVALKNDESAKFLIIGPETLQADLRVNLAPNEARAKPILLVVLAAGKQVARYRITPRAGADTWKGRTDLKPSASLGFYVAVDAGPHAYEFRVENAPRGAALFLTPKAKARRPLAANAPVIPSRPPVAKPTPTPAAVAAATPTPAPTATPKGLDALGSGGSGPRADEVERERRAWETAFKAGFATPSHDAFSGAPVFGAEARRAFGARRSIAAGVEVQQLAFSALSPDDPNRAEPPSAVDVQLLPVSVNGVFSPFGSRLQPYVGGGATVAYGSSVLRRLDRRTIPESLVGFGGQLFGGVQYDLGGTEFREGGQRVFLEVKGSYLTVPFEAHDFTNWSTVQLLAGVSMKF